MIALIAAQGVCADGRPAVELFVEGRYLEAGDEAGTEAGSADAQALAARAYAAAAILADDASDAETWALEARRHAEAAIALDPRSVEGRLQLAVALWLSSRSLGGFEAYRKGLPQQGRALIEAAVADAPGDAWAQAMLGAWHFEALRRGGRWARRLLHADLEAGEAAFARAMSLDPGDAAIPAHLGLAYLSLDVERYAGAARTALGRAVEVAPRDAFENAMQARAREALRLMDAGDLEALQSAVERWVGG